MVGEHKEKKEKLAVLLVEDMAAIVIVKPHWAPYIEYYSNTVSHKVGEEAWWVMKHPLGPQLMPTTVKHSSSLEINAHGTVMRRTTWP